MSLLEYYRQFLGINFEKSTYNVIFVLQTKTTNSKCYENIDNFQYTIFRRCWCFSVSDTNNELVANSAPITKRFYFLISHNNQNMKSTKKYIVLCNSLLVSLTLEHQQRQKNYIKSKTVPTAFNGDWSKLDQITSELLTNFK